MIQSFSPPKVVRQHGVTALLLYQAQTVAFMPQRLWIPKKTVGSLFLILRLTYCAGRWQSTSWSCYCLTKSRTRSPGNHHTIGITAHVDCEEHTRVCKKPAACLGCNSLVFRFSGRRYSPIHFLKHPVEMRGVLVYD